MSGKPGHGRPRLATNCSIEGCDKGGNIIKGYCHTHYTRLRRHGSPNAVLNPVSRHGLMGEPEYHVWRSMKARCNNPNNKHYADYGGRGITVCERWSTSFQAFYDDMGQRPTPQHSIDRKDNDGIYELSNCRWATKEVQAWNRNKRKVKKLPYIGIIKHHNRWGAYIGIKNEHMWLGAYDTPEEAAIAYDVAAIFFRGNIAVTNIL